MVLWIFCFVIVSVPAHADKRVKFFHWICPVCQNREDNIQASPYASEEEAIMQDNQISKYEEIRYNCMTWFKPPPKPVNVQCRRDNPTKGQKCNFQLKSEDCMQTELQHLGTKKNKKMNRQNIS